MLNQPYIPKVNPTWLWCIILYCYVQFANIFHHISVNNWLPHGMLIKYSVKALKNNICVGKPIFFLYSLNWLNLRDRI